MNTNARLLCIGNEYECKSGWADVGRFSAPYSRQHLTLLKRI